MKLVSIVGARPQFVKLAPLSRAFEHYNREAESAVEHIIVHTGQHYDSAMSEIFFEELKIPPPNMNLGVGSAHHGRQTGEMLEKIEQVLLDSQVDMVVVYGDTNSTLAGALAAAKLHIPVAHVEAGLRSFNRLMPEEINRLVADHVSHLLLAPTPTAVKNLKHEGLSGRTIFTGDIMYDAILFNRKLAKIESKVLERLGLERGSYGLVTVHRAENTDNDSRLFNLVTAFNQIAASALPLVFPVHPRTANRIAASLPTWSPHPRLHIVQPVGYFDMLSLIDYARITLTDSGGLQKEAFFLGCPTITLREETEWPETVHAGANILAGTDRDKIFAGVSEWEKRLAAGTADISATTSTWFGDGRAAEKIRDGLLSHWANGQ
jgi:UDP-GlcNAc3NAcA epimerase